MTEYVGPDQVLTPLALFEEMAHAGCALGVTFGGDGWWCFTHLNDDCPAKALAAALAGVPTAATADTEE